MQFYYKHRTGEKWLKLVSNVQTNAVGAGRRGWFSLAFLQIVAMLCAQRICKSSEPEVGGMFSPSAARFEYRGTSEAHLLLCGFLIDTAHKQSVPAASMHQRPDHCHFQALLVSNLIVTRHECLEAPVFGSASKSTRHIRACQSTKPNSAEACFCPKLLYMLQTRTNIRLVTLKLNA